MAERIKVTPEVCSYADSEQNTLNMEISIPGVKKEDVNVRMTDEGFYLSAPREDIEYVSALAFCCPVQQDKAEAKYEDGLLKIKVPFKDPMDGAVKIQVS
jgi:HSP20 family molecular chaperone IbpA